jgi:SAM-dependent methyltransferase
MGDISDLRRHAPATLRNREPILEVLRRILPPRGLVLEIASGSGEHAAFFAEQLPALRFQPSDPAPEARASISAWTAGRENVLAPIDLDAAAYTWPVARADAILNINMIHISPWRACLGLMRGSARLLEAGAPLYLYGPFKEGGAHTAPSNERFDAQLRAQDAAWGVRDLEAVIEAAAREGLAFEEKVPMPANNLSVIFRRQ